MAMQTVGVPIFFPFVVVAELLFQRWRVKEIG